MFDATCTIPKSTPATSARRSLPGAFAMPIAGLLIAGLLVLTACGPVQVRSAPPGTDLDGVALEGDTLALRLLLDNRNDVPLALTGARLRLTLDSIELERREWPLDLVIGPRNREAIVLRLPASGAVQGRLAELDDGQRASLPYTLVGELQIAEQRDARIDRAGFLHPVPGRAGRYR
ncbi:hypothetical protein [Halomonas denitrificans]|nr:hypothetical protein [Halomonas denitrificans]